MKTQSQQWITSNLSRLIQADWHEERGESICNPIVTAGLPQGESGWRNGSEAARRNVSECSTNHTRNHHENRDG